MTAVGDPVWVGAIPPGYPADEETGWSRPRLVATKLESGIFKPSDAPFARARKLLILFHTRIGRSVAAVEAGGGDKQMHETTALSAADADIARRRTTAPLGKPVTFAGRSSRAFPEGP